MRTLAASSVKYHVKSSVYGGHRVTPILDDNARAQEVADEIARGITREGGQR
jgi:hypothetical protein